MFESKVFNWLECGASCLDTRFCLGYNFKEGSSDGQIMCQLTHTGDQTFERISTEDNCWTFYKTARKRMVRVLSQFDLFYIKYNCTKLTIRPVSNVEFCMHRMQFKQ